ncbi:MAG TPA: hypothetical protein VL225_15080 [Vicinamibacterales bacterium]|nr:hypothetical protein [Vicinamibacterales bacterium]
MTRSVAMVFLLLASAPPNAPSPFTFRAGFWNNLHHFLYVLGRARNGEPDSRREAVARAPEDVGGLAERPEADRQAWEEAVRFYAGGLSKQDLVFDKSLIDTTRILAEVADDSDLRGAPLDPALTETLRRAAPVYRAVWWPRQSRADAARQRDLEQQLAAHGAAAVRRLTSIYGTAWPAQPRVVNLSAYTNWAGAYSTDGGLIVFSSTDDALVGSAGLEILLHESSHQWDDEIEGRLRRIADAHGTRVPRDLSHMLIFYTSGEVVRELISGYVPYAIKNGVWDRGSFRGAKPILDSYWRPYLQGTGTFDEAVAAMLAHMRQ